MLINEIILLNNEQLIANIIRFANKSKFHHQSHDKIIKIIVNKKYKKTKNKEKSQNFFVKKERFSSLEVLEPNKNNPA